MKHIFESFSDKKPIFIELLEKDNSALIHKRNLRFLAIEMFKFKTGLAPTLCTERISHNRKNRYGYRNNTDFTLPLMKSFHKGLESLSHLGPKIWEICPVEIKQTKSLLEFKAKIKHWNPQCFPYRLYKVHLQHVGFI